MSTDPPEPQPLPPTSTPPGVSNGLGTYASLAGIVGAIAAFVISWAQYGMTAETVTLGATAGGILAAWYTGRSQQAKAIATKAIGAYQEHADLGDVAGIPPDWTPPAEGEAAVAGPEPPPVEG